MSENKTMPTKRSVTAFVNAVAHEQRRRDAKSMLRLMKRITGATPKMWGPSIIGYGQCHYRYASGREGDMPIAGFSPRKADLVVYLLGLERQQAKLRALGPHRHGKSCLYLKSLDAIDLTVLEEMIRDSVARARKLG